MTNRRRQGGLWDLEIEDVEFETAIENWLADKENRAESAAIGRARKDAFEKHKSRLKVGQRVRVGGFCFVVGETDRDEYTVQPVRALGMRDVSNVLDAAEGE